MYLLSCFLLPEKLFMRSAVLGIDELPIPKVGKCQIALVVLGNFIPLQGGLAYATAAKEVVPVLV